MYFAIAIMLLMLILQSSLQTSSFVLINMSDWLNRLSCVGLNCLMLWKNQNHILKKAVHYAFSMKTLHRIFLLLISFSLYFLICHFAFEL